MIFSFILSKDCVKHSNRFNVNTKLLSQNHIILGKDMKFLKILIFLLSSSIEALCLGNFDLYNKNLDYQADSFEIELIKDHSIIPKAAGPLEDNFNTSIIWAKDKNSKIIAGFRAINTTTGCQSGCTPVIFHLMFDYKGNPLRVIEDENYPLRKINHETFTSDDLQKINDIVIKLPTVLSLIKSPKELTNNHSSFPPQTWTYFKETVITGAAYTTFIVYSQAMATKLYLQKSSENIEWKKNRQKFIQSIQGSRSCQENSSQCLAILAKYFSDDVSLAPTDRKEIVDFFLFLIETHFTKQPAISLSFLKEVIAILNQHEFIFRNNINFFIELLKVISVSSNGEDALDIILNKLNLADELPKNIKRYLPIIAQIHGSSKINISTLSADFPNFIEFCLFNPEILNKIALYLISIDEIDFAMQTISTISIYYPGYKFDQKINDFLDKNPKSYISIFNLNKDNFVNKMLRDFSIEGLPFPIGLCIDKTNQTKTAIPLQNSNKRIYIFFAAWCGHCKDLVKTLLEKASPRFLEKIQLVEVFNQQADMLDDFIQYTRLLNHKLSVLSLLPDNQEFYKKMSLYAVPKIIFVNQNNEIINFNFDLNSRDPGFERNISWLLESLN